MLTDDQTELSATRETIRKDRILAKLSVRWDKVLKNELHKLNAEQTLFDKRHIFERNHYKTRLKKLRNDKLSQTTRIFGLVVNKTCQSQENNGTPTEDNWRKPRQFRKKQCSFMDQILEETPLVTRRDLKWSLNDFKEVKCDKIHTNSCKEPSVYGRLPVIKYSFCSDGSKDRYIKKTENESPKNLTKTWKLNSGRREITNMALEYREITKFPDIVGFNH